MADISLTIKSNFEQASKDLKAFGTVTESTRQRIEKFTKEFKSEQIDNFVDRQNRAAAAVKATRGPMASLQSEARAYQREIERLIKRGLDPESDEVQKLTARYIKLQQEIQDTTEAEKKHEKASALTAASMVYLAQQAIDVGRKVVDVFADLTTAAGDYVESVNAVNVVFEESGQQIIDFGQNAKTAVGLSKTAFNELATTTGAMMKQAGISVSDLDDKVIELTQRAADTASVFNKDVDDALGAFNAALRGEAEPARRFAVNISDAAVQAEALAAGLVKNKNEITDQIKIQARYNLIMKQTSDFAGDFANTQDSFSNQLKIAKAAMADMRAEMGEMLLPIATKTVSAFTDIIQHVVDTTAAYNDLKAILADYREDGVFQSKNLQDLIDKRQILIDKQASYGREASLVYKDEIAALTKQIETEQRRIELAKTTAGELDEAINQEQARIQAAKDLADAIALLDSEESAIAERRMTENERKAAAIDQEIVRLADLREMAKKFGLDYAAIQEEINTLDQERKDLRAEDLADVKKTNIEAINADVERERAEIVARNNVRLAAQDAAEAQRKAEEAELAKTAAKYESTYAQIGSTISKYAGIVTDAFQGEKTAAEAMEEIFKDGAVKLLNMLGQEATARAAMATAKSLEPIVGAAYVPEAIGWGSAAAAAFLAAGVVGSFQTGTLPSGYTVPESSSSRQDPSYFRVNPGEKVTVTPRGESGTGTMNAYFQLGEETLIAFFNAKIESGDIVISNDNIQQRAVS